MSVIIKLVILMKAKAKQIRSIYECLSRKEKIFLGGAPFTSEIGRELANYQHYFTRQTLSKERTRLGLCIFDECSRICGYQVTTILDNANPTAYEKEFIKINPPLNYVQLKTIFLHPDYQGKGYSDRLLELSLDIAKIHEKDWTCDVMSTNKRMIRLLGRHDIKIEEIWLTPNYTKMLRFRK